MKRAVIAVLLLALKASAQVPVKRPNVVARAAGYVKTHKVMFALNATVIAVNLADAKTTIAAEGRCPSCVDMGFFGRHPSSSEVYLGTSLLSSFTVAMNLLSDHYVDDRPGKVFFWSLWSVPFIVSGAADISDNLGTVALESGHPSVRDGLRLHGVLR